MRTFLRASWLLSFFLLPAVNAEPVFPLGRNQFPEAAAMLPYGCSVGWYQQKQDYTLEHLTFAVPGGFPAAGQLTAENKSRFTQLRPNLWLLPFLEVYGVFGHVRSDTVVRNVPLLGQVTTTSRGKVYGAGATLVGGFENWFATAGINATRADMDQVNSSMKTVAIEPHVGRNFSWGALWLGAMHLDTEEKAAGTFALPPLGTVPYSVTLRSEDPWNYHVGGQWRVTKHIALVAQAGLGQRRSLYGSLDFSW